MIMQIEARVYHRGTYSDVTLMFPGYMQGLFADQTQFATLPKDELAKINGPGAALARGICELNLQLPVERVEIRSVGKPKQFVVISRGIHPNSYPIPA